MPDITNVEIKGLPEIGDTVTHADIPLVNSCIQVPSHFIPVGPFNLQCRMFSNRDGLNFWSAWRDLVYDYGTDSVGLLNQVAGSGEITIFSGDSTLAVYELLNVWPSRVAVGPFSVDEDGLLPYSITLVVNQARLV
jgi:hypothetical protein